MLEIVDGGIQRASSRPVGPETCSPVLNRELYRVRRAPGVRASELGLRTLLPGAICLSILAYFLFYFAQQRDGYVILYYAVAFIRLVQR